MSPVIRASLRAFSIPANFEELFRPVRTFAENQDHSNCNLPAYVALAHKAKLQSGAQAEDLRHTQAAEAARAARKKGSNRVVQKGGAIYVDKARHSSKVRERSEVEKAELALKRAKAAERKERDNLTPPRINSHPPLDILTPPGLLEPSTTQLGGCAYLHRRACKHDSE
jgi:hypothetical protein